MCTEAVHHRALSPGSTESPLHLPYPLQKASLWARRPARKEPRRAIRSSRLEALRYMVITLGSSYPQGQTAPEDGLKSGRTVWEHPAEEPVYGGLSGGCCLFRTVVRWAVVWPVGKSSNRLHLPYKQSPNTRSSYCPLLILGHNFALRI